MKTPAGIKDAFLTAVTGKLSHERRIRPEKEGRTQEAWSILDDLLEGYQILDREWRYVYINRTAERFGRQPHGSLTGKCMLEMFPGIGETELFKVLNDCMTRRINWSFENEYQYPDGTTAWFEHRIRPVQEGLLVMTNDITEKRKDDELLRSKEKQFSRLFENMNEGFALCKMVYQEGKAVDFIYLEVNRKFEELTGLKNVCGKKVTEVIPGVMDSDSDLFEFYEKVVRTGIPDKTEFLLQALNMWFSLSAYSPMPGHFVAVFDVITERKEKEEALKSSLLRLNLALEGAQGGTWEWDVRTNRNYWSDQLWKVYGLEPFSCEPSYDNWLATIHPDDRDKAVAEVTHAATHGTDLNTEWRVIDCDGTERWLMSKGKPFLDEHGTVIQYYGVVFDITARKTADKALAESEQHFRELYENASIGLYRTTPEGEIIMVNPAVLKMLGFESLEELNRRNLEKEGFLPGYDRREFRELMERKSLVRGLECQWKKKDGTMITIRESAVAVRDSEGKIIYYNGTVEDITEQKWLQDRQKVTLDLLEICNNASGIKELVKDLTGFFVEFTGFEAVGVRLQDGEDYPYFETRGFSREFVRLETLLCCYDEKGEVIRNPDGSIPLECMCGNIINGNFDPSKEFFTEKGSFWSGNTTELLATTTEADRRGRTRNRCHREGYETVVLVPLKFHGKPFGLFQFNDRRLNLISKEKVGILEELVDYVAIALAKLKSDEEVRRLNESLEKRVHERTQELEAFNYSVSHDLRAPLRAIAGFSHVLLEDHGDRLDEEGRSVAKVIQNSTAKMAALIDDLLAFSRVGRTEMKETHFSMQDLISECIQDLSSAHSDEQVITVCGPVPDVMADRALIRQVWINLLSNALKFSAGAGEPKVVVACSEEEGGAIFSVTDNGVGFDMKYADKLFNVFQRLHSSKSFEGTGVGLAIVRRIIERHNGKVWAHSEPGKGATFHFTINPNPNDKH